MKIRPNTRSLFVPITLKVGIFSVLYILAVVVAIYQYSLRSYEGRFNRDMVVSQDNYAQILRGLIDNQVEVIDLVTGLLPTIPGIAEALSVGDVGVLRRSLSLPVTQLMVSLDVEYLEIRGEDNVSLYKGGERFGGIYPDEPIDWEMAELSSFTRLYCTDKGSCRVDAIGGYSSVANSDQAFEIVTSHRLDMVLELFHSATRANIAIIDGAEAGHVEDRILLATDYANTFELLGDAVGDITDHSRIPFVREYREGFYAFYPLDIKAGGGYEIIAFNDVTEVHRRDLMEAKIQALAMGLSVLVLSLLVIRFILRLIDKMNQATELLPLLSEQRFEEFRSRSGANRKVRYCVDEADKVLDTAMVLNERLERYTESEARSKQILERTVHQLSAEVHARKESQRESDSKSQYIAVMSHELRNPLSVVVTMSQMLTITEDPTKRRRYVESIEHSAGAVLELIDNILDLSRLEILGGSVDTEHFSLVGMLVELVEALEPTASIKGITLTGDLSGTVRGVYRGDKRRLHMVLINLICNAIKYTETGGVRIRIECSPEVQGVIQTVKIRIIDTGPGIPDDIVSALFDPFVRQASAGVPSSGLGTYIAKRTIEALGGRIELETTQDVGSIFSVTLPLSIERYSQPGCVDRKTSVVISYIGGEESVPGSIKLCGARLNAGVEFVDVVDVERWVDGLERDKRSHLIVLCQGECLDVLSVLRRRVPSQIKACVVVGSVDAMDSVACGGYPLVSLVVPSIEAVSDAAVMELFGQLERRFSSGIQACDDGRVNNKGLRVLVAEDSTPVRAILVEILSKSGYRVDEAIDGRRAFEKLKAERYDIGILDVHMPGMSGMEAVERVRNSGLEDQPRFVLMTGDASGVAERASSLRGVMVITKPITPKRLLESLEYLLSGCAGNCVQGEPAGT